MSQSPFIHLHCRTAYSLLEGAIKPKDLVKLCEKHQMPAVAIADHNNMFGSLELSQMLAKAGVQPIIGCLQDFLPTEQQGMRQSVHRPAAEPIVLLAQNEGGYQNLLKLNSEAYLNSAQEGEVVLDWPQLQGLTEGIIALTGGINGPLVKRLNHGKADSAQSWLKQMMQLFEGRLYVEIQRHGLEAQKAIEPQLLKLAEEFALPIVATNDVYFADRKMHQAHDALLCISDGAYVSQTDRKKVTAEHYFKNNTEMTELFRDLPEAIENTSVIAKRCSFLSPARDPILPRFGTIEEEKRLLKELAEKGLEVRLEREVYPKKLPVVSSQDSGEEAYKSLTTDDRQLTAAPYRERLEYELGVINSMGFPGYFLIVADFIQWSKENDIPVGPGRGSGAGSVVAWALKITDLDPLRYGLLFERFLNPERVSMPDFDIDFCQDRRDEVIRYVQTKYGSPQVAQIITYGKLQARAVLRDVGRVMQLSYGQVDRICKLVPNNPAAPVTLQEAIDQEPSLREAIRSEDAIERMVEVALQLEGLYRHASTHAAGVVIGDRPLVELLPLYRDPKSDMLVVQYSMKYAEMAGLVKFDFLGLKTLTVLETARKFIKQNHDVELDLLLLPEGDKITYDMLGLGDSTGVFQLESAGMRDTLRKLKPDTLEDIIALVSLYRPGPMDNIPTYIARKHGRETPEYLHPKLEPILQETFGVMIYQEQVMQIAQQLASYSLGEADLLRRAMGKKIAAEMEAQRALFTERAIANGIKGETAKAIFDLMAKFASYGFNKSHAAAYALIAYQTAYLKANYPAEFLAASMTYDLHNTDKISIFKDEAERIEIEVLPPDVNFSFADFRTETQDSEKVISKKGGQQADPAMSERSDAPSEQQNVAIGAQNIRYALGALKNVGTDVMLSVVAEREANGKFTDIYDFVSRLDGKSLNKRQMENLIRAGAFDSLEPNRRRLFDSLEAMLTYASAMGADAESEQDSLFAAAPEQLAVPKPPLKDVPDWTKTERLNEEFKAIGFFLSAHPLAGYAESLDATRRVTAASLESRLSSEYVGVKLAGIVGGIKYKRSSKGRFAFVGLSDESAAYEASIFDEYIIDSKSDLLVSGTMVMIGAEAKKDESGVRIIVKSMEPLDKALTQRTAGKPMPAQRFEIETIESLLALKQVLEPLELETGMPIILELLLNEDEKLEIKLAKKYSLTLQQREKIEQEMQHIKMKAA